MPDAATAEVPRVYDKLRSQSGPQSMFLASRADVCVYGGAAFSGKSYALLLDDLRAVHIANYRSVTFRRETTQIRNPGALWDESCELFARFGVRSVSGPLEHTFPSGATVKYAHLEHASSVYAWDSSQIPVLKFDQLESFESSQFWYMLSRNRDPSGSMRPYCRAACNPRPGWLADLLAWWIDADTGYAIWERSGVLRWLVRVDETIFWGDTHEALWERFHNPNLPDDHADQPRPLSFTFIPGRIWDNKIGLERDPGYLSKLKAMQRVERLRLLGDPELGGNWKVVAGAGNQFSRHWCETLPAEPANVQWCRGWDLAATRPSEANTDPDWTVGVRIGKYVDQRRWVIAPDVMRDRIGPAGVERALLLTAHKDGPHCSIRLPQDPGQAGKAQVQHLSAMLAGYPVASNPVTGDKITRFAPFSAQAEVGNVDLVAGIPDAFLAALENFPDSDHDDDVDAVSEAFSKWSIPLGGANIIEYYRRMNAKAAAKAQGTTAEANDGVKAAAPGSGEPSLNHSQPMESVPVSVSVPLPDPVRASHSFAEAAKQQGRSGSPESPGAPLRLASVRKDGNEIVTSFVQGGKP